MSPNGPITKSTILTRSWLTACTLGAISAAFLILGLATSSLAQETNNAATGGESGLGFDNSSKDPLEISADNGIEWKRDARTYTARGNALAKQGGTSVSADTL